MNPRIDTVIFKKPYRLILMFKNGEQKEFDISPYLSFPVFEKLKDKSFCSRARVINGTVAWDDEIDFDPDTLYLESRTIY